MNVSGENVAWEEEGHASWEAIRPGWPQHTWCVINCEQVVNWPQKLGNMKTIKMEHCQDNRASPGSLLPAATAWCEDKS